MTTYRQLLSKNLKQANLKGKSKTERQSAFKKAVKKSVSEYKKKKN